LHDEVEYFLNVGMEVRAKRSRWCFDLRYGIGSGNIRGKFDKTVDRVSLFFPAGAAVMMKRLFWITDRLDCIMGKFISFLS
jgi:hypothetical protein